ncbi:MAG: hypothetical protein NC078_05375 [Ruminococcus sp.]|nr:hypothetical protein [Ruminococcus sp.]
MNKVMNVLTNKWFRMVVSLLGVVYAAVLVYFDYIVFFYDIEYTNRKEFALIGSAFCVVMGLLIFYTRRSPFTCILAMADMVLFFPLLLLDWGNWPLLVPCAVLTLFGFFCCHMNETAKTIFGTIFLLMYILGGIAFFLVMNVFRVTTTDTLIERGESPSGAFRYYVLDVQNKSTGKKCVYVQPNTLDVDKGFIKLDCTIKHLVKQSPNPCDMDCHWSGSQMLINGEVYFDENDALKEEDGQLLYAMDDGSWTYTYFSIEYPIFNTIEEVKGLVDELLEKIKSSDSEDSGGSEPAMADVSDSGDNTDGTDDTVNADITPADSEGENADDGESADDSDNSAEPSPETEDEQTEE